MACSIIVGQDIGGWIVANRLLDQNQKIKLYAAERDIEEAIFSGLLPKRDAYRLLEWQIAPERYLNNIVLRIKDDQVTIPLKEELAVYDMKLFQSRLQERVQSRGGFLEQYKVLGAQPKELFLQDGRAEKAEAFILTSRSLLPGSKLFPRYRVIEGIWQKPSFKNELELTFFSQGYLMATPLGEKGVRFLGLVPCDSSVWLNGAYQDVSLQLMRLLDAYFLNDHYRGFDGKLGSGRLSILPRFGWTAAPYWPGAFFAGDALAQLPPLLGADLSFVYRTALLAADQMRQGAFATWNQKWRRNVFKYVWKKRFLHYTATSVVWHPLLLTFAERFPHRAAALIESVIG